ncbi:MAG: ArsR/SmtB family transcription factor [Acidimicrobiales bacterium]
MAIPAVRAIVVDQGIDECSWVSCEVATLCRMLIYVTAQIHGDPTESQVDVAVDVLKLLADGTRLRIVWALLHGEHSVNELAAHLGMNPAGVSQHLAKLRLARLVMVRREGNKAFYAAKDVHVRRLVEEALFHTHHVVGGPVTHDDTYEPQRTERRRRT